MAEPVTKELIYEMLRQIREDVSHIRQRVDSHDEQFKGVRHLLIAIHLNDVTR